VCIGRSITFFYLGVVIIFTVPGCGDEPTGQNFNRRESSNYEERVEVCQEHRKCSGEDCCVKDDDCKDMCRTLFKGANYGVCINEYDRELVESLETLEATLSRPKDIDLITVDRESLCAFLQLSSDKWLEEINRRYTPGNAEEVIKWIFSTGILHLFSSVEERLDIIKSLLVALVGKRGKVTTGNILNGLTKGTVSGKATVFYIADYVGDQGKSSFELIHEELIVNDICDAESNQPHPNSTSTKSGENCYYNNSDNGFQLKAAIGYRKEACILALHCLAGADDNSKAERTRVANLVSKRRVVELIDTAVVDGGLGIHQEPEEWPSTACLALKDFWHNRSLNFGLGTVQSSPQSQHAVCPR